MITLPNNVTIVVTGSVVRSIFYLPNKEITDLATRGYQTISSADRTATWNPRGTSSTRGRRRVGSRGPLHARGTMHIPAPSLPPPSQRRRSRRSQQGSDLSINHILSRLSESIQQHNEPILDTPGRSGGDPRHAGPARLARTSNGFVGTQRLLTGDVPLRECEVRFLESFRDQVFLHELNTRLSMLNTGPDTSTTLVPTPPRDVAPDGGAEEGHTADGVSPPGQNDSPMSGISDDYVMPDRIVGSSESEDPLRP
ncbi:hypothetical protein BJX64DRAFT_292686 [Aspergillus heterothallicus]